MVLLRIMDDRFMADLWCGALDQAGIPHLLRTYQDTAYDGLYVSQKGYASLYVDPQHLERAREIDRDLLAGLEAAPLTLEQLARSLDHTLLDPAAGPQDLERHLEQCLEMGCAAACVSPWMVPRAAQALAGSPVAVCTVVGFPLGTESAQNKLHAAQELAQAGATELDVVLNRGLYLGGRPHQALQEIQDLARAVKPAKTKLILEVSALGAEATRELARQLIETEVDFVKTGTGYFGPATLEEVALLTEELRGKVKVKAAGGIRDLETARNLLKAGAHRLGTSSGFSLWRRLKEDPQEV